MLKRGMANSPHGLAQWASIAPQISGFVDILFRFRDHRDVVGHDRLMVSGNKRQPPDGTI
jgi:hypothetical protein